MKTGKLIDEHSKRNAEIIEAAMKDPSKYQECRIIRVKGKEVKVWERS